MVNGEIDRFEIDNRGRRYRVEDVEEEGIYGIFLYAKEGWLTWVLSASVLAAAAHL